MTTKNSRYLLAGAIAACLLIAGFYIVEQKKTSPAHNTAKNTEQNQADVNKEKENSDNIDLANAPSTDKTFDKPGWESSSEEATLKTPADKISREQRDKKIEELNELSRKLNAMSESQKQDPAQVAKIIAELEKITGASTMHGVRLDVLRQNLVVAENLQKEAATLEQLMSKKPTSPDLQKSLDSQRDAQIKKLQEISMQMNTAITVDTAKVKLPGSN
jgi:hypothetical protein